MSVWVLSQGLDDRVLSSVVFVSLRAGLKSAPTFGFDIE